MSNSSQVQALFSVAACHANSRCITLEGVRGLASEFAGAFDKSLGGEGFCIYAMEFARLVRPGMSETPAELLQTVRERLDYALQEWTKLEQVNEYVEGVEISQSNEPSAEELHQKAVIEKQEREAAEAAAVQDRKKAESEILEPKSVNDTPVESLKIDPRAKKALRKEGLDTVGDVKTYAAAKPLEDIHGIGPDMAKATMAAIDALGT